MNLHKPLSVPELGLQRLQARWETWASRTAQPLILTFPNPRQISIERAYFEVLWLQVFTAAIHRRQEKGDAVREAARLECVLHTVQDEPQPATALHNDEPGMALTCVVSRVSYGSSGSKTRSEAP